MANTQSKENGDKWRKVAFVVAHREKVRRVAAETAAASGASSSKAPFKACVACRKYNKSFLDNLLLYTADVYADFVTFNDDQIAQLLNKMSATVPKLPFCKDCWTKWRTSTECWYVETSPTSSPTTGSKRKSSSIHPSEPVEKKPARKLTRRQKKQSVEFTATAGVITKTEPISEEDEEVATIMTGQPDEVEEGEIVDDQVYEKVPQELHTGIGQPTEHDCLVARI